MIKILTAFVLAAVCLPALAQNGTVVVYRPGKYVGSALKPSVYVDGTEVGRLKNGRYMYPSGGVRDQKQISRGDLKALASGIVL